MKGLKLREDKMLAQSHRVCKAGGGLKLADPWPGTVSRSVDDPSLNDEFPVQDTQSLPMLFCF